MNNSQIPQIFTQYMHIKSNLQLIKSLCLKILLTLAFASSCFSPIAGAADEQHKTSSAQQQIAKMPGSASKAHKKEFSTTSTATGKKKANKIVYVPFMSSEEAVMRDKIYEYIEKFDIEANDRQNYRAHTLSRHVAKNTAWLQERSQQDRQNKKVRKTTVPAAQHSSEPGTKNSTTPGSYGDTTALNALSSTQHDSENSNKVAPANKEKAGFYRSSFPNVTVANHSIKKTMAKNIDFIAKWLINIAKNEKNGVKPNKPSEISRELSLNANNQRLVITACEQPKQDATNGYTINFAAKAVTATRCTKVVIEKKLARQDSAVKTSANQNDADAILEQLYVLTALPTAADNKTARAAE